MTLDDARRAYPGLGMAVYAIEPGGKVTLEVYADDGQIFSFAAPTEAAALAAAFPPEPEPEAAPEPASSVFD